MDNQERSPAKSVVVVWTDEAGNQYSYSLRGHEANRAMTLLHVSFRDFGKSRAQRATEAAERQAKGKGSSASAQKAPKAIIVSDPSKKVSTTKLTKDEISRVESATMHKTQQPEVKRQTMLPVTSTSIDSAAIAALKTPDLAYSRAKSYPSGAFSVLMMLEASAKPKTDDQWAKILAQLKVPRPELIFKHLFATKDVSSEGRALALSLLSEAEGIIKSTSKFCAAYIEQRLTLALKDMSKTGDSLLKLSFLKSTTPNLVDQELLSAIDSETSSEVDFSEGVITVGYNFLTMKNNGTIYYQDLTKILVDIPATKYCSTYSQQAAVKNARNYANKQSSKTDISEKKVTSVANEEQEPVPDAAAEHNNTSDDEPEAEVSLVIGDGDEPDPEGDGE